MSDRYVSKNPGELHNLMGRIYQIRYFVILHRECNFSRDVIRPDSIYHVSCCSIRPWEIYLNNPSLSETKRFLPPNVACSADTSSHSCLGRLSLLFKNALFPTVIIVYEHGIITFVSKYYVDTALWFSHTFLLSLGSCTWSARIGKETTDTSYIGMNAWILHHRPPALFNFIFSRAYCNAASGIIDAIF